MIATITNNIDNIFFDLVKNSRNSIKLCAPFVKKEIVAKILDSKSENVDVKLVTNCTLNYFHKKSSDIEALELMINNSYIVANQQNLHAKIYIFDDKKAIITSANLTYSGFNRNIEYGLLTDESNLVGEAKSFLKNIIGQDKKSYLDSEQIATIKKILLDIPQTPKYDMNHEISDIFESDKKYIADNLTGWTKLIFSAMDTMENKIISLSDFNSYFSYFKNQYPKNNNIEAKIRQQLQVLRNIGLVKFEDRGVYKKLWI
ncbi:MAG: type II deoxyribonuclease [Clostridia bacterium]|nr:type II deoxyribonuclease [Clostridia bacterium]